MFWQEKSQWTLKVFNGNRKLLNCVFKYRVRFCLNLINYLSVPIFNSNMVKQRGQMIRSQKELHALTSFSFNKISKSKVFLTKSSQSKYIQ